MSIYSNAIHSLFKTIVALNEVGANNDAYYDLCQDILKSMKPEELAEITAEVREDMERLANL